MTHIAAAAVINDENQQPQLSVLQQKNNLTLKLLVELSCI
jgi:hypothetical protein